MRLDVRTKKTIEEGIQLREEVGGSTFLLFAPGNGTIYLVLIQKLSDCSPKLKDRLGLRDGDGWLVTHMGGVPMTSMVVIDNQGGLLHWEYVREKLQVSAADAVVLAELIGHVTGREYIPSEEFLEEAQKPRPIPCCERDHNRDGDCDRHPGSEAPNR
jgi:hypothetical protein